MGILIRPSILLGLLGLLVWGVPAVRAGDFQIALDLRAVSSNGRESFLRDGQGKLRYDADHEGVQLGRLRAAWEQPLGEVFAVHAEASVWDDEDKNPVDLTEAFVEYRPYPRAGFRTRARLGAFYPPMSLENRALGWQTPYTLTPSAISSWVGEELRTIGLEGQVDWLGTRLGHDFDFQVTAALFGWNDPAGTQLSAHGFAFNDRQTTLFGRVGEHQPNPGFAKKELFCEMDDRPGYYLGAQARWLDRAILNILHYDNRADPTVFESGIRDFAWLTKFDAAAVRYESGNGWTVLVQALDGTTDVAPGGFLLRWEFDSQSALLAKRFGPHMLAARYDVFDVTFMNDRSLPGSENGRAWTVAYSRDAGEHWRFAAEWLRVTSDVKSRPVALGATSLAIESKVEVSARYVLSGGF
jgi:hypothetical protein